MTSAVGVPAGNRARAVGRLLRISLAPSAVADVVAGVVLGAGTVSHPVETGALALGSLCVYHGAMAWNDWADRAHDAATRPDRPLPAGALSARFACLLGALLLVSGPALPLLVSTPAVGGRAAATLFGVASLAGLYDLAGRGPWIGPTLLALCRAGNLGAGILLGAALTGTGAPRLGLLGGPALYGAYVFVVSRLGRLEDGEDEAGGGLRAPRVLLAVTSALLLLPPLLPSPCFPAEPGLLLRAFVLVLLVGLGVPLWSELRGAEPPSPARIRGWMGLALGRLIVLVAALAVLAGGWSAPLPGLALFALFPLARRLARRFPPS